MAINCNDPEELSSVDGVPCDDGEGHDWKRRLVDLIGWGVQAGWDQTARLAVLFMAFGVPFALVSTWARHLA